MTIRQSKLTTSRVRSLHLINKSFEFLVFKLTLGKFFNSLLLILGKFNLYPENCIPYLLLNVYMHVRYPNKGFNQTQSQNICRIIGIMNAHRMQAIDDTIHLKIGHSNKHKLVIASLCEINKSI